PTRRAWNEDRSGLRRGTARAEASAQSFLSHVRDAGADYWRISNLEATHSHFADHRGRPTGFLVSPGKRSLSGSMVASRTSGPLFVRSHRSRPVLRLQYSSETYSRRTAETRVQGPPEIQTE